MKTQNFGRSLYSCVPVSRAGRLTVSPAYACASYSALKDYRENRENGLAVDDPKTPFPSACFDTLDIKKSDWKSFDEWPDRKGRYWWRITLNDGRIIEDFYWTQDNVRGYPDKNNKERYWYIVHHASMGFHIEGFSVEPDYNKGFPDKDKDYWYIFQFTDTHCSAIRQWMDEKDRNYLARLNREKETKKSEKNTQPLKGSKRKKTTPIKAVTSENKQALKRLAKDGETNWREVDKKGNNVFHLAAKKSNFHVLGRLLKAVPSKLQSKLLTALNDNDDTPLHIAAGQGDTKVVNALLKALGNDVTACLEKMNVKGHTVLHEAVIAGRIDVVQALIKVGVNQDALTKDGKTAQQVAEENSHGMLSQLLKTLSVSDETRPPVIPSFRLPLEESEEEADAQRHAASSSASSSSSNVSSSSSQVGLKTMAKEHKLIIPPEELQKGKLLGKGGFGAVYQGNWYETPVAIKELLMQALTTELEDEFQHETQMMLELRHPNVVQLLGITLHPHAMVMEFMSKGSLDRVLQSERALSWGLRYRMSLDVAKGVAFLHRRDIVHRDLKSLNVLLTAHDEAKLADFGLSRIKVATSQSVHVSMAGTTSWIAPELFENSKMAYTLACDVYSYGMVLWEMLSRRFPYGNVHSPLIPFHVMQGNREIIPEEAPSILKDLTATCWDKVPEKRPSMQRVVERLIASPVLEVIDNGKKEHSPVSATSLPSMSGYQASQQERRAHSGSLSSEAMSSSVTSSSEQRNTPVWAKAIYAFQAKEANQLSFEKSATLRVLKRITGKWWVCEYEGRQGYAPSNYLVLAKENTSLSEAQQSGYARSQFYSSPTSHKESHTVAKGKAPSAPQTLQSGLGSGYD